MRGVSSAKAWATWAFAAAFYAYQYVLRVLPNILAPDLIERFQTTSAEFGQFAGLYYIGYAGAHIPIGLWLDRHCPKIVIPSCVAITIVGVLPLIFSESVAMANIGRLIMGAGSSGAVLGLFKVIRIGFPESHFNRLLGLGVTVGLAGAVYGGLPVGYMLEIVGWRSVIVVICWIGAALAIATYFAIPRTHSSPEAKHVKGDLRRVLTDKKVVLVCALSGLMVGPLEGFADVWGAGFLRSVYKIDAAYASGMTSLIFLGMGLGSSALTYLADKSRKYVTIIILCGAFMASAFFYLLTEKAPIDVLAPLLVAIGVCCAYQIIAIYVAASFVPERLASVTTAVTNMIVMIFGYFFHSVIGMAMGSHELDGTFPAERYETGLAVIPIGLLIACVGFVYIEYGKRRRET